MNQNAIIISTGIQIPIDEFDFSYARSGGPGGQNVNKVASKAILRWCVTVSPSLPDDVRARFVETHANKITGDGDLVISSDKHRDQPRNRQECLDKLQAMIEAVAVPPAERIATKPSKAVKARRVDDKRAQSKKKEQRRWRRDDY